MKNWHELNLYDKYESSGNFILEGVEGNYGGTLLHNPGFVPIATITAFFNQPLFHKIDWLSRDMLTCKYIQVALTDGCVATLLGCRIKLARGNDSVKAFDIFIRDIIFDKLATHNEEIEGCIVKYNIWNIFILNRSFLEFKDIEYESRIVDIDDSLKILFSEECSYTPANVVFDVSHQEDKEIKEEFENILKNRGKGFYPKKKIDHICSMRIIKNIKLSEIEKIYFESYKIALLLFSITGSPVTPESMGVLYPAIHDKIKYTQKAPWLMPRILDSNTKDLYKHNGYTSYSEDMIFFDDIEVYWDNMLKNYYAKYDELSDIIEKILANFKSSNFSKINFASTIDALSFISDKQNYPFKKKYQKVIAEFSFDNLDNYLKQLFEISAIEEIGEKISMMRAYVVHPATSDPQLFENIKNKSPMISEILSLICFSYIQREIGLPKNIRMKFQNTWLSIYSQASWIAS